MDRKEIEKIIEEILERKGVKILKVGNKTTYVTNDEVHIASATPKVHLEGTETGAANVSIRENAGGIEIYDEASASREYNLYPKKKATLTFTIPIGGGSATGSIDAATFGVSTIDYIVNFSVNRKDPVVNDVYQASYGLNAGADAIGITLAAGTGTTLEAEVEIIGIP